MSLASQAEMTAYPSSYERSGCKVNCVSVMLFEFGCFEPQKAQLETRLLREPYC